jgi:hypothetical protein
VHHVNLETSDIDNTVGRIDGSTYHESVGFQSYPIDYYNFNGVSTYKCPSIHSRYLREQFRRTTDLCRIHNLSNLLQFVLCQLDIDGRGIVQPGNATRSGNRHNLINKCQRRTYIIALNYEPGKRKLTRGATVLFRNFLQIMHNFEVLVEIFLRKARGHLAEINDRQVASRFDLTREKIPTKGRISNNGDTQLSARF